MTEVHYLNVDLEIDSKEDLSPLAGDFPDDHIITMYNDKWGKHFRASFEIAGSFSAANEDIDVFCMYIESLDDEPMRLWDNAFSKVFNIGYECCGSESSTTKLSKNTLKRIAGVGASLEITIYPARDHTDIAATIAETQAQLNAEYPDDKS